MRVKRANKKPPNARMHELYGTQMTLRSAYRRCLWAWIIFILLLLVALPLQAQKYTISGYVKEQSSGELLPGATVYLPQEQVGVSTNVYGFYSITLEKGEYLITFSFIGLATQVDTIKLDQNLSYNVELITQEEVLEEVVVTAEEIERESEDVQMSQITLNPKEVDDLPTILGEKDVLKVLQLYPGVQSGNESLSGIYVRGGGNDQNLFILDDAVVYNANHLFGFFSVFNGDALKAIELYKGGFPARYGGRLSSVLDVNMKEGNKEEWHGKVGMGIVSSQFMIEGPIKKGKTGFLFSGRRSWIDVLTRLFSEDAFSYYLHDLNLKLNHEFSPRSKLYLSGYYGEDAFRAREDFEEGAFSFRLSWGNITGTLRWNYQLTPKTFSNLSFVVSDYGFRVNVDQEVTGSIVNSSTQARFVSQIQNYNLKYDVQYFRSLNHTFRLGTQTTFHRFNPNSYRLDQTFENESIEAVEPLDIQNVNTALEQAVYAEDEMKYGIFQANAGLRVGLFQEGKKAYIRPEPRLSTSLLVAYGLSLKGSYTRMNQYVHLLSLSGSSLPTDLWVPSTDKVSPQISDQIALGIVKDVGAAATYTLSLEGYYKWFRDIIAYRDDADGISVFGREPTESELTDNDWESQVTTGTGYSYGLELLLRKNKGRFSGWIGYTWAFNRQQFPGINNNELFFPRFDRRHDVSVVGNYQLSPSIVLSGSWIYGTGNNYTVKSSIVQALRPGLYPTDNSEDAPHVSQVGFRPNEQQIAYERYNFRAEPTHRLDLNVQYKRKVGKKKQNLSIWQVGAYNVYARQNPFFFNTGRAISDDGSTQWVLKKYVFLRFLPFITYRYEF